VNAPIKTDMLARPHPHIVVVYCGLTPLSSVSRVLQGVSGYPDTPVERGMASLAGIAPFFVRQATWKKATMSDTFLLRTARVSSRSACRWSP